MAIDTIPIGADGFYHPASEDEIVALIKSANEGARQIRVRGAAHSLAQVIYTDPGAGDPPIPNKVSEQAPPKGPNYNLMLDKYARLEWIDESKGIIECEAGIHLGRDPYDPTQTSTLENSLLYQIFLKGWALRDLGGISHQTVSGFLSTGSSGGSLMYGIEENILAFRVIDGQGDVRWIERNSTDQAERDLFAAVGVSMGLLGIISKVRLQLTPTYNVYGQEITTLTDSTCPIDLFGPGTGGKPSMQQFLKGAPYSRLLWWPQKGSERIVIWQASAVPPTPVFTPVPYQEFGAPGEAEVEELAASIFFTLAGNLDDLSVVPGLLDRDFDQFEAALDLLLERMGLGDPASDILAKLIRGTSEIGTDILLTILAPAIQKVLPSAFPTIIDLFQPLSKDGKPTMFQDYAWSSLPMDNSVDDILLGTEFTEIWIPIERTEEVMQLLKDHFDQGLDATGYFSTELYAAKKSPFWLSPSYEQDMFRVDLFWFINNAGNPATKEGFYAQFWDKLRARNIPFRLHWGKFLPEYDFGTWAAYYQAQYPKLGAFLTLRSERDPNGVFLTDYWKRHLGI